MLFKAFSASADTIALLNSGIQRFISTNEAEGYEVADKQVHVEQASDNSLIKPVVVICIWMEKIRT